MISVPGYEGRYSVTKTGRVYSHVTKQYLKAWADNGYLNVRLSINGERKKKYIHRLVAECHVSNPKDKPEVNHKDGNKANNNHKNLEWVTRQENIDHSIGTGLTNQRGETHPMSKLTEKQVYEIRRLLNPKKTSYRVIAELYDVSINTIFRIHKNRNWTHL